VVPLSVSLLNPSARDDVIRAPQIRLCLRELFTQTSVLVHEGRVGFLTALDFSRCVEHCLLHNRAQLESAPLR
jgi:hypothetical protein